MIANLIEGVEWETLAVKAAWLVIICTCVLVAMIVDLISGVKKAHEKGQATSSYGLKRTVDKAIRYYGLMILCFLLDVIAHLVTQIPYFTIVAGIYLVVTEIFSWYEKADQKEKKKTEMLVDLLKNRDDIIKGVADALSKQIKEEPDKE